MSVEPRPAVFQLLRANLDSGLLRVWTGDGDYEFDEPFGVPESEPGKTATYVSGAGLAEVTDGRARFVMRGEFMTGTPVTGRQVVVWYVGSESGEPPFTRLPLVVRGLLERPQLYRGEYTVDVVPAVYERYAAKWSNEEHQAEFPGDTFFSQQKALERGALSWWPNPPVYNPAGHYGRGLARRPNVTTRGPATGQPGRGFRGGADVLLTPAASSARPGV